MIVLISRPTKLALLWFLLLCLIYQNPTAADLLNDSSYSQVKHYEYGNHYFDIDANTRILISDSILSQYRPVFNDLFDALTSISKSGNLSCIKYNIVEFVARHGLDSPSIRALTDKEGYTISINTPCIEIQSSTTFGLVLATERLTSILNDYGGHISEGFIADWPDHRVRGLHFVARLLSKDDMLYLIRLARKAQMNTLIVDIRDGVRLASLSGVYRDDAINIDEFIDVINIARKSGLEFIPEIKLLSHQSDMLARYGDVVMYNRQTYDPRSSSTYRHVFSILDEVISLFHPQSIHIGHDEVVGWSSRHYKKGILRSNEKQLPPDLFLQDVIVIHNYLSSMNVKTWMWGDMLLSSEELSRTNERGINGTVNDYYKVRSGLPKDIIICDWHYYNEDGIYPSLSKFMREGFTVIGASWKNMRATRSFSKYAYANKAEGMIATTWWLAQSGDRSILSQVIVNSGRYFWNAIQ